MIHSMRLRSLLATGALAIAMVFGVAQPAHATLSQLTVRLSDPDLFPSLGLPPIISDTGLNVIVPPTVPDKEIFAGNGTNIGDATPAGSNSTLLLANDYVNARPTLDAAAANRIVLGVEAGNGNQTGYSPSAYYSFSEFAFSTPSVVTGVKIVSAVNIDGLGMLDAPGSQVSFDRAAGIVKVMIGNFLITGGLPECGEGVLCGTITMDLTVQAVPEPGTWMLIAAGLAVVVVVGRQRHRS
jgi:PEP-CTERM motif